jgi:cathepsin F
MLEDDYRYQIFIDNLQLIEQYQREDPDAHYGITKFADLTPEEFQRYYLGLNTSEAITVPPLEIIESLSLPDIPDSLDWRQLGAVTVPKAQAICGSCWAFSAAANIEGQYFLKQNMLRNFSEQELVDCDTLDQGCDGGYMQNAFTWLSQNGGLEPEENYPYFGIQGTCKINPAMQIVQIKGYLNISSDEGVIAEALYQYGPLSTGINGNKLQFYNSGIFSPSICKTALNHGVLFVGYGTAEVKGKSKDYWIIKNSWGADWGEQGYFRISRGTGKCGINLDVSTSVLE